MSNESTAFHPQGFEALQLRDYDVAIDFDGESAPLHHHFTATTLRCAASSEHPAFQAPYLASRMTDGAIVVLFVKATAQPIQLVTLVIDEARQSALAACHSRAKAGRTPWTLTVLRGAVNSRFTFANLTAFPLSQPPVRRVLLDLSEESADVQPGAQLAAVSGREATFNRHGHLTMWRDLEGAATRTDQTAASGRMLAVGPRTAVLPWTSRTGGGTFLFDREHSTYWGVLTLNSLIPDLRPTATHGRVAE